MALYSKYYGFNSYIELFTFILYVVSLQAFIDFSYYYEYILKNYIFLLAMNIY